MNRAIKITGLALVIGCLFVSGAEASSTLERLSGKNRIETSIEISRKAYNSANTVILTAFNGEVDALSGTLLANYENAPMLITSRDKLDDSVLKRIKELKAKNIIVLGGTNVVSLQVEETLEASNFKVTRIGGRNREDTALKIAEEVKGDAINEVFLTLGYGNFADALAIGPVSSQQKKPIFLTKTSQLPNTTKEALKTHSVKKVTIVGGKSAVSDSIEEELKALNIKVDRISGKDRMETALNIAKQYTSNPNGFVIANGYDYADALIGGYFSVLKNKPILLVKDDRVGEVNLDYINQNRLKAYILGGQNAINEDVFIDIDLALKEPLKLKDVSLTGTKESFTPHKIGAQTNVTDEVLYKFSLIYDGEKEWEVIQDYKNNSSIDWFPEIEGKYKYKVEVKYINSRDVEAELIKDVSIEALKPAKLTSLELLGNRYKDKPHTITAKATSTNGVLYKFYLQDKADGKWTLLQDYSENNTVNWTPKKYGEYRYMVRVKDKNSKNDRDDAIGYDVTINPPVSYTVTNYNDSLKEALDKQMKSGTRATVYESGKGKRTATREEVARYIDPNRFLQFDPKVINGREATIVVDSPDTLNVRSGPGANFPIVTTTTNGSVHEVFDEKNNWYLIEVNGKRGWGSGAFMKISSKAQHLLTVNITTNNLNVRAEADAKSDKLTTVSKDEVYVVLEEKNNWYKINANNKIGWVSGAYAKHVNDVPKEMYQFMVLSGQVGISASDMNKELVGKGILEGRAAAFIEGGKKYNINELYLMAHAFLETGNGKSKLATGVRVDTVGGKKVEPRVVYNMYGIGAYDKESLRHGSERAYTEGWFTPELAITEGANWISEGYINSSKYRQDTLYKMRWNPASPSVHQYAQDVAWPIKQTKQIDTMMEIYRRMDNIVLKFDIPRYK